MSIAALPLKRAQCGTRVGARQRYRLIAGLIFAGCGACVHYQSAPLEPKASALEFAARRLDDPHLREAVVRLLPRAAADWPPHEWDRGALLAVALAENPDLRAARALALTVRAHEMTAAQLPNPNLTLESEYALHDTHPWLYGIGFDWLLRSRERRRLDIELARLDTSSARMQAMNEVWSVRHALAAALSDGESARRRLALLDRLAKAQERLVAIERRRIDAGEDPPSELLNSERARIEVEQQQSGQRALAQAALSAAARALGLPPQALDGVALAWPDWGDPPPVDEEELRTHREQALLTRSDLRVAMGEYAAAETKLHLAIARQYPEFTLGPGYYWDHGIAKFPLDVGFELPFNGNKGEIAEALAGRGLAGERMLALQADIYSEVAAAERAERIARANLDAADRQWTAARRQLDQTALGVRLGASDSLEEIAANIIAMRAELEVIEMRTELQSSRNQLEDVLHTPLSGPELDLKDGAT